MLGKERFVFLFDPISHISSKVVAADVNSVFTKDQCPQDRKPNHDENADII